MNLEYICLVALVVSDHQGITLFLFVSLHFQVLIVLQSVIRIVHFVITFGIIAACFYHSSWKMQSLMELNVLS